MGNNDEQPADKEVSKANWFKKLERPPTPDFDWNKRQHGDSQPSQAWIRKPYPFDLSKPLLLIRDHRGYQVIPRDFFINNDLKYLKGGDLSRQYSGPKRQHFYGFAAIVSSSKDVYSRKRIIAVTRLTIMKKYDYGHLEETEVSREDQKLYKFREEADQSHNRRTVCLKCGITYVHKMDCHFRKQDQYTAYSDPKGVIYKDQMNKNRLMRPDELHKFSDGTLDDVWSALNDIAKGIRMEYLPKRKWSGLDKRRAWVMIQDIDKQLYERRLMRNLEKFIGGREYGNDLRLLEWTI
ncbi:hypothetical protein Tco_1548221 [Tanacetum coccineum]